jgi:putative SOS response-associated peptidase YedK
MPLIIPREQWGPWLDPSASFDQIQSLCTPFAADAMEAYPVSPLVSNTRNEGAELAKPAFNREEHSPSLWER